MIIQGILDFSREFDVSLMDKVVIAFYSGVGQEVCFRFHIGYPCTDSDCISDLVY